MTLDLDFVRRQFPALSGDWVFMDNAGGSQVLSRVAERISDYLLTSNVQTGATYEPSQRSTERVRQARRAFAGFVNAADAGEIVMGASTTMLIRLLSEAMTGTPQARRRDHRHQHRSRVQYRPVAEARGAGRRRSRSGAAIPRRSNSSSTICAASSPIARGSWRSPMPRTSSARSTTFRRSRTSCTGRGRALRRCRRLCAAPRDRRSGAWRRLLHLQRLQGLRTPFRGDVGAQG